ncbi:hypothetical protein PQX77_009547 [Marasmius sp. AFHP31]|nr:hypothetical protein PQX77_009547 [Marasmius sp. AFHP31]
MEVRELRRSNEALQTSIVTIFADARATRPAPEPAQPSTSATTSPTGIKPQPEHYKEKPKGCCVEWWNRPPSKDKRAFKIMKIALYKSNNLDNSNSDSDDDDFEGDHHSNNGDSSDVGRREGIFAWMQHFDGTLISFNEKKEAYKDQRRFWNGLDLSQPPRNYSSLKHTQINNFVTFMEERHDWLALCSGHWKAHEILKSNYKSWRRTYLSRQRKEAAKLGKKDRKKERKEKCREREQDSKQRNVSDEREPRVVVNLCDAASDSDGNEVVIEAGTSKVKRGLLHKSKPQGNHGKSSTEGTISSKQLSKSFVFAPTNVVALEKKALDNAPSTPSAPFAPSAPSTSSAPSALSAPSTWKPIAFIEKFAAKVKGLPQLVPCAKKGGAFTQYSANDPSTYTKGIPTEELWPRFDTPLTLLIPSGDHEARKPLVTRGVYGLPALVKFLKHLVYDRGMDPFVLEPKLEQLTETIDLVVAVLGKKPEEPKAAARPRAKRKDSHTSVRDAKRPVKKSKKLSENSKKSNAPDKVEVTGVRMETVGGSK